MTTQRVEVLEFTGQAAPAVGAASTARLYFDSGTNLWMISLNGAAYAVIGTPGGAPADVTKAAAAAGTSNLFARADHKHDITTAAPAAGSVAVGNAAAEGTATTLARSDHVHPVTAPAAPADVTKAAASAGASTNVARADHKHDISTGTPVSVGAANTEGSATSLARSDHVHNSAPATLGGTLASVGTTASERFFHWYGGAQNVNSGNNVRTIVPRACNGKNLYVRQSVAGADAVNNTYALRVGASTSALSVTVANNVTTVVSNTGTSVALVAGDEISMAHSKSGASAGGATDVYHGMELAAA